ncbi:MAG: hypothetical protein ACOYNS_12495 [Bacteroidota bacterium]
MIIHTSQGFSMKIEEQIHSTKFKVLLPILIVSGMITIFKGGIAFGHWIYAIVH